jgi:hypothetical protein
MRLFFCVLSIAKVVTPNICVNRISRQLEGSIEQYSGGGGVTV